MSKKVTIFVTSFCPFCTTAKRFLTKHGIEFDTIDVSSDAEKRNWLVETTGMRTVPQIFVGETPVGGYTDMEALHRSGEFVPLLEKNGVAHTIA